MVMAWTDEQTLHCFKKSLDDMLQLARKGGSLYSEGHAKEAAAVLRAAGALKTAIAAFEEARAAEKGGS